MLSITNSRVIQKESTMSKLQIHIEAPDFTLHDFTGKAISLSDYRDTNNVLLVFNRGFQ